MNMTIERKYAEAFKILDNLPTIFFLNPDVKLDEMFWVDND